MFTFERIIGLWCQLPQWSLWLGHILYGWTKADDVAWNYAALCGRVRRKRSGSGMCPTCPAVFYFCVFVSEKHGMDLSPAAAARGCNNARSYAINNAFFQGGPGPKGGVGHFPTLKSNDKTCERNVYKQILREKYVRPSS